LIDEARGAPPEQAAAGPERPIGPGQAGRRGGPTENSTIRDVVAISKKIGGQ